jgi:hypothetical protein
LIEIQQGGDEMKDTIVVYYGWTSLETRGAAGPGEPESVNGSLLVGPRILSYVGNEGPYGSDSISLFPAFYNGGRCWIERLDWYPVHGYSASGAQESIISFDDGVRIFLERGMYKFPKYGGK